MKNILVFGDSNMWGEVPNNLRLPFEMRFAGILQGILGTKYHVTEDNLPGRMARMDDPLSPNHCGFPHLEVALESQSPVDLLIMQLGSNEARDMLNMNAETIACSLERLIKLARSHPNGHNANNILLIAPHPFSPTVHEKSYGFLFGKTAYETSLHFGEAFRNLARRMNTMFFDCATLKFKLNKIDGIHYAAEDHERLAHAVAELILKAQI